MYRNEEFRPLGRYVALKHDTVEIADLTHVVVAVGLVQKTAIVPNDQIAGLPAVTVFVLRSRRVGQQIGEQLQSFLFGHTKDALSADWIEVERFAAGFRMCAN